jgi:hypothetical protein
MRGFLPVGVTTQLSWTTSLRHARDRIRFLKHHPCKEVREVIKAIHAALLDKYPHSFKASDIEIDPESEDCIYYSIPAFHYIEHDGEQHKEAFAASPFHMEAIMSQFNPKLATLLAYRPERTIIPQAAAEIVNFDFIGLLDFGSYRDIQRHRRGWCPIPLVTDYGYGINEWYLKEVEECMSKDDYEAFADEVNSLQERIRFFNDADEKVNRFELQYLYPLGINLIIQFKYNLAEAVYVSELRSQPTVHDTLRPLAQFMGEWVNQFFRGANICRFNTEPSAFNIARGKQTIFKDGKEIE